VAAAAAAKTAFQNYMYMHFRCENTPSYLVGSPSGGVCSLYIVKYIHVHVDM
jgi:hypothetical protein